MKHVDEISYFHDFFCLTIGIIFKKTRKLKPAVK